MNFSDYLSEGRYGFPRKGAKGVESDWLDFGQIEVPIGSLWLGDATVVSPEEGYTLKVSPARYIIELKGIDLKGIRTFSRARVFAAGSKHFAVGAKIGEAITDSSIVGICDIAAMQAAVKKGNMEEFEMDLQNATAQAGTGIDTFLYGKKQFDLAYIVSGLGDGAFPVYSLKADSKVVGVEVEFLPPNYIHKA